MPSLASRDPAAPARPRGCSSLAPHTGRSTLVGEKSPTHVDVKCSSGPHRAFMYSEGACPRTCLRTTLTLQQHWPTRCAASLRARCSPEWTCSSSNSPPAVWGRMKPSFHGGTTSLQGAGSSAPRWRPPPRGGNLWWAILHFRRPSDHRSTRRSGWAALVQPPRLTTT